MEMIYADKPHRICDIDLDSFNISNQLPSSSLGFQPERWEALTRAKTILLRQFIAWTCRFFQPFPARPKRTWKCRWWSGLCPNHRRRCTAIISQLESDCLHPAQDDATRHAPRDVPHRNEQCLENIGGRTQNVIRHPQREGARSRDHKAENCELWL